MYSCHLFLISSASVRYGPNRQTIAEGENPIVGHKFLKGREGHGERMLCFFSPGSGKSSVIGGFEQRL